ncbi:hypothetical protein R1flu_017936 [Riccia fluitans]|uniref:Mitochondrial carrier protein n=1 Tax=Riccia fluitans TaxID=41844 RepID=A0ABD1ZEE0_9MARC
MVVSRRNQVSVTSGVWTDNFMSGASASLCSKIILQPFDTSKTLLQATKDLRGGYSNLAQCMVGLVRNRGFGALYTGFLASIAVSAPSSAVFAAGYEFSKTWIEKAAQDKAVPLLQVAPILAAAFGNLVASVVRVPPEIIKQRVQAGIHQNVFEATRAVWMKEGLAGFYRGYTAMVARDIPYSALQFMTFEILKKRRRNGLSSSQQQQGNVKKNGKDFMTDLWMGAIAGAVASSLTTPLDVVKTRVMTQTVTQKLAQPELSNVIKQIWVEEGFVGFGRGMLPRVLYKVPASAVFLVCYEAMKRVLSSTRRARQVKSSRIEKARSIPFRPIPEGCKLTPEAAHLRTTPKPAVV